jgi:hypothetical protein
MYSRKILNILELTRESRYKMTLDFRVLMGEIREKGIRTSNRGDGDKGRIIWRGRNGCCGHCCATMRRSAS